MNKIRKFINDSNHYLRRVARSPIGELTRWQQTMRFAWDLVWHCWRALQHDRASEMAAALTYRTIFSLIPLMVMGLLVFQAFYDLDNVRKDLTPIIYDFVGIDTLSQSPKANNNSKQIPDDATLENNQTPEQSKDKDGNAKQDKDDNSNNAAGAPTDAASTDGTNTGDTPSGNVAVASTQVAADAQSNKTGSASDTDNASANTDNPNTSATGPPDKTAQKNEAILRLDERIDAMVHEVKGLNFGSIGAVGLVLFLWAGLALAVTMEQSFNVVFNAPQGRPWHHRIPIYWAIITLGPVLVWLSISIAGQLINWAEDVAVLGSIVRVLSSMFALAASWLMLFLLYKLMPHTSVNAKAAIIGSFVGASLWELAKFGFRIYVTSAEPYANIYGALALIPLFLLWIYLTWIIVLFGLELTYTLQALKRRRFKYELPSQSQSIHGDPQWLIPIMAQIARAFEVGKTTDHQAISDNLKLPDRAVVALCRLLEKEGFIRRVTANDDDYADYTLARPAEQILVRNVLEVADKLRVGQQIERKGAAWLLLRQLSKAQRKAVGDSTLTSLLQQDKDGNLRNRVTWFIDSDADSDTDSDANPDSSETGSPAATD